MRRLPSVVARLALFATTLLAAAAPVLGATITFREGVDGYTGASNASFAFDGTGANANAIRLDFPDMIEPAGSYAHLLFEDVVGASGVPGGASLIQAILVGTVTNAFGTANAAQLLQDIASRPMSPARIDDPGVAGTFYDDTTAATADSCGTCDPPGLIAWDVTAIVQAWVDGDDNFGFLLLPETTNGGNLATVSDPTLGNRPLLVVTFVPEPALIALLAVGAAGLRAARRRV